MSRKTLTPIVLPADPAAAMEAATKQYVDAAVTGGVKPAMDWFQSTATTSIPTATYNGVPGWTRVASVANPGYVSGPATGGVFTVLIAGLYLMTTDISFSAGAAGRRITTFHYNGVEDRRNENYTSTAITTELVHCRYMAVNDTIEPRCWHNLGSNLALGPPNHNLQIIRLA